MSIYGSINSALVAFYASKLITESFATKVIIPAVGLLLSAVWAVSGLRTRERRIYAERRAGEIEEYLSSAWAGRQLDFVHLDLARRSGWEDVGRSGLWRALRVGWLRNIPASRLALGVPPIFFMIWVLLLVGL